MRRRRCGTRPVGGIAGRPCDPAGDSRHAATVPRDRPRRGREDRRGGRFLRKHRRRSPARARTATVADTGRAPGRRDGAGRLWDRRAGTSRSRSRPVLGRRGGPPGLPARNQRAADRRPVRRPHRHRCPPARRAPIRRRRQALAGRVSTAQKRCAGLGAADVRTLAARAPGTDRPPQRGDDRRRPRRLGLCLAPRRGDRRDRPRRRRPPGRGPPGGRFPRGLDLDAAARFDPAGDPVDGRSAQGDAAGWVAAADRAVGFPTAAGTGPWRGLADYQEKDPGDYLGNAIAAGAGPRALAQFESREGLVREAGSASGLDAAAAWAVRPFPRPALLPAARRTLLRLVAQRGRFGITPSQDWPEGDPWTAPTAWCAWSLATLGERRPALELMADLRRAATPLGLLPERVDARTGIPRSTTPLAWSHAFAILALRALWP